MMGLFRGTWTALRGNLYLVFYEGGRYFLGGRRKTDDR